MININYKIISYINGLFLKTRSKFKTSYFLILLAPMFLTACNTISVLNDSENSSAKVPETNRSDDLGESKDGSVDSSSEQPATAAVPQVKLDGDMLFNLLAAEFAGNTGDVEASLKYYRKASASIEDSRIAARTAYIALYGKDYEGALEALDRWRELEPESYDLSRMYAITYLRLQQPEQAVPHVKAIFTSTHNTPAEEAMAIKQLLAKESRPEDAYIVLQKLNEDDDKHIHLLVLQSRYASELGHYDEALSLLDQVLEMDPSFNEVSIIKARILFAQGKKQEATQLVKQVLDDYPDNDALRLQYARMLVEQRNLTAATEQYEVLYEHLPDNGDIALSLSLLYIETKNLDAAVEIFEHLIEIDKQVPVANYYLGRIAQNQGDDKQAVAYYLRVNSGSYVFDAQLRIGILLAVLGKPDEGLAKLEALAEAQSDWKFRVKAYLAQGEVLRREQRFKEGVEMYSRALQQNGDDTMLLYARGLMAEKVDRLDMAEADLLKVISKEPENADALNALGYTLADRTARYEEALTYIQRAAELVPDDPAILDSLGWVSYRLGKMEDAIKWLSKAFAKMEDAEIAAHYGEVLWHTDQKDKAREVWKKGQENNADNPVLRETLKRINP